MASTGDVVVCSFCGKTQTMVGYMTVNDQAGVAICAECIEVSVWMMAGGPVTSDGPVIVLPILMSALAERGFTTAP